MLFKQITLDPGVWFRGADFVAIAGTAKTPAGDEIPFTLYANAGDVSFYVAPYERALAAAGLGLAEETVTAAIEKLIAANASCYYGPEITKEFIDSYFEE